MRSPPSPWWATSRGSKAARGSCAGRYATRTMADPDAVQAPHRKRNRLRYAVVAVLCLGAGAWMLVLMQKNGVFFKTVSQSVHDEAHDGTRTMRIGGGVGPATITQRS